MKALRICLLLLLAVLLPLRGAMAAAMLCPALGGEAPHAMQMDDADEDMAGDEAADADTLPACDEHPTSGNSGSSGHGDASPCKLCCAFCSLTPLPGGLPSVQAAPQFGAAAFREPLSPAPSFVSGGPERPPKHPTHV